MKYKIQEMEFFTHHKKESWWTRNQDNFVLFAAVLSASIAVTMFYYTLWYAILYWNLTY